MGYQKIKMGSVLGILHSLNETPHADKDDDRAMKKAAFKISNADAVPLLSGASRARIELTDQFFGQEMSCLTCRLEGSHRNDGALWEMQQSKTAALHEG